MTFRDKINALSDEEMAKILERHGCKYCINKLDSHGCAWSKSCVEEIVKYLKKEVKE